VRPAVYVAVISGGRPRLDDRKTRRLLPALRDAGYPVEWVVRSDQAADYDRDDFPINAYPVEWADRYSKAHWRHPVARWEPGGFHGAFPGREWAMRTGAECGADVVLLLDDNVVVVGVVAAATPTWYVDNGVDIAPLPVMVRLLVELCISTNAAMCGMQLSSIQPRFNPPIIRPGYPYSVFAEKVGPGRLPWFGPYEDDVMHALEYALHGGPSRTAAVVPTLTYRKESKSKNGMRRYYDPTRGLELARRYPHNAKIRMGAKTSSPNETERGVRHYLTTTGFTPVRVTDPARYTATATELTGLVATAVELFRRNNRDKTGHRAGLPTT
jgi:hypothetical protein